MIFDPIANKKIKDVEKRISEVEKKVSDKVNDDTEFISSPDIISIKVLTQSEYDDLPSSKNTDNILYLIKEESSNEEEPSDGEV